ncbi:MAG: hypothetical protein QOF98_1347, partial [Streptomyces sp.]|nr:hypothetical protein [Streptomyces sp.]
MVTFAQAQERAERWVNGDVSGYETREIRVREFDLGFVVWSEARADGPTSDDGSVRVVIARDSGEATLWPALPIGELIRRYEEEYGPVPNDTPPDPPQRLDLEATSFFLSPPQWLQDAADRIGIPDRRAAASAGSTDSRAPGANSGAGADNGYGSSAEPAAASAAGGNDYPLGGPAAAGSAGVDFRRRGGSVPAQDAAPASVPDPASASASASGGIDYRRPGSATSAAAG